MVAELSAAIGDYPNSQALKTGQVSSGLVKLDFAKIPTINRAFAPMVRELKFDLCEMAIATFLQAKQHGKRLALLPVVTLARFQESALLCRADSAIRGPADLAGRRVGVRAYSQTTGLWLRGAVFDDYGVTPEQIRWLTFEDAHVAEYRDPPFAERAAPGQDLATLLREGAIDAAIFGADAPNDPSLRTVFPDPAAAARVFWDRHGFTPVNHMICVKQELAETRPELVAELMRMFREAKAAAPAPEDGRDPCPIGRDAVDPALALAARYAAEQGLTARRLSLDDIWRGSPFA